MLQKIAVFTGNNKEVVDITARVQEEIDKEGFTEGIVHLFVKHTTAALTTADLDPGTDLDLLDAIEAIAPKLEYRHPHNPGHAKDHIMASVIGPAVSVPVEQGELQLGSWQRIVLIELDGPRERTITLAF